MKLSSRSTSRTISIAARKVRRRGASICSLAVSGRRNETETAVSGVCAGVRAAIARLQSSDRGSCPKHVLTAGPSPRRTGRQLALLRFVDGGVEQAGDGRPLNRRTHHVVEE